MFDRAAVSWLVGHIEMLRREIARLPAAQQQGAIDALGGVPYPFFGECITKTYGGEWAFVNGEYWGIDHRPRAELTTFPQKKMYRSLAGDETESPLSMFDLLAHDVG